MNASPPQNILKWIGFLIGGVICIGGLLDALSNSISIVSPRVTLIATSVVVPVWLLIELAARVFGIPWHFSGGSSGRIRALGPSVHLGIVGALALLWLPRLNELLVTEESIPALQVELSNLTETDVAVATRGEFVLWLPTAMYDVAPRIGGTITIHPLRSADDSDEQFLVPGKGSVRCSVSFLNPKRFFSAYAAADTDFCLTIRTSLGIQISDNAPFSRGTVGKRFLAWQLESKETSTTTPYKTDADNGSNGSRRAIDASRSPSPDPKRSPNELSP